MKPWSMARWQMRISLLLLLTLLTIPLWFTDLPPLFDLPDHIGRYAVQAELGRSAAYNRYYGFEPHFVANLGADIAMLIPTWLLGVERAAWWLTLLIVLTMGSSLILLSRVAHGKIQPGIYVAFLFVYSRIFSYGLMNFLTTITFVMLLFPLWIAMADKVRVRAALFLILSPIVMLGHAAAWANLALLIGGYELGRIGWAHPVHSLLKVVRSCWMVALPFPLLIFWRVNGASTAGQFEFGPLSQKFTEFASTLRDQSMLLDVGSMIFCFSVLAIALIAGARIERRFVVPLALVFLAYWLLPRQLFGSGLADKRQLPLFFMLLFTLLNWHDVRRSLAISIAVAACALLVVRIAFVTESYVRYGTLRHSILAATDHVAMNSRVFYMTEVRCRATAWPTERHWHLGAIAMARRQAWVNQFWHIPGQQLVTQTYVPPGYFRAGVDDAINIRPDFCPAGTDVRHLPIAEAAKRVPTSGIDYVWLIAVRPETRAAFERLHPLPIEYANRDTVLYRVSGNNVARR